MNHHLIEMGVIIAAIVMNHHPIQMGVIIANL
jgi:hypothetical protein